MSDNGKGDAPRPLSVPKETYDRNFARIFGERTPVTPDDVKELIRRQQEEVGLTFPPYPVIPPPLVFVKEETPACCGGRCCGDECCEECHGY
jgi:hypothetical protein